MQDPDQSRTPGTSSEEITFANARKVVERPNGVELYEAHLGTDLFRNLGEARAVQS